MITHIHTATTRDEFLNLTQTMRDIVRNKDAKSPIYAMSSDASIHKAFALIGAHNHHECHLAIMMPDISQSVSTGYGAMYETFRLLCDMKQTEFAFRSHTDAELFFQALIASVWIEGKKMMTCWPDIAYRNLLAIVDPSSMECAWSKFVSSINTNFKFVVGAFGTIHPFTHHDICLPSEVRRQIRDQFIEYCRQKHPNVVPDESVEETFQQFVGTL